MLGKSRAFGACVVTAALLVAGCSGGGKQSTPTSGARHGQQATNVPAGTNPSASTKMVCGKEVRGQIAAALNGLHETRVTTPTWTNHIYSCTYVYPKGSVELSVKELVSAQETTAYFSGLANRLGRAQVLNGLGRAAFVTRNDDVVVRKDNKVLFVDVQAIPAAANAFLPMMKRSDVALSVAVGILGCWNGG